MERHDLRYSLLCALLVLGAVALTIPVAECGVNDDWSYTKTALDLAQTGHLIYNWWTAPLLGARVYWGALFIKLFGFSFLAVRLSTAPLCRLRRSALRPAPACRAAPAWRFWERWRSPCHRVFILNAVTFMTDVPALFFLLASVYGFVRVAGIMDGINNVTAGAGALPRPFWRWLFSPRLVACWGAPSGKPAGSCHCLAPLWLLPGGGRFCDCPLYGCP